MKPKSLQPLNEVLDNLPAIAWRVSRTPVLRWLYLLDSAPPKVARAGLSLASGLMDPYFVGKGLKVEEWNPQQVGLYLPDRRITKGIQAQIPPSVILSLASLNFRLFWEWQLGPGKNKITLEEMNWKQIQPKYDSLRTRYEVPSQERDQLLFQVQAEGATEFEARINVLNGSNHLVGEVEFKARLEGPKALISKENSR